MVRIACCHSSVEAADIALQRVSKRLLHITTCGTAYVAPCKPGCPEYAYLVLQVKNLDSKLWRCPFSVVGTISVAIPDMFA